MNFSNHFRRIELDRFSSQPQRSRCIRDPFEGDPFKIQSLNFHYADKPSFYPVSSRGRGQSVQDRQSEVKDIYYNHDHSIPKRDKENIPLRRGQSSASPYAGCPQKPLSSVSSLSNNLASNSVESGLTMKKTYTRTFISQPTMSVANSSSGCSQSRLRTRNASTMPHSTTNVPFVNSSGCHITIKINGVPKNRVQIKRSDGNVEINLAKVRKSKKPQSPPASFKLKPSRSYIIHKKDPTLEMKTNTTDKTSSSPQVVRGSSTHSMIPHREERSTMQGIAATPSGETLRSCSRIPLKTSSNLSKSSRTLNKQATLLEKILTHNPIVVKSRMKDPSSLLPPRRLSSSPILSLNRAMGKPF